MTPRLIIFGRNDETTRAVYHRLASEFDVRAVVLEEKVPGGTVFMRRRKRLGLIPALGQALFVLLVQPLLVRGGKARIDDLKQELTLNDEETPKELVTHISSINDEAVREVVRSHAPTHIIVNGTRLLTKDTLDAIDAPIINIHLGWNPRYRGGNGAYWAFAEDDADHAGVTVHLIDEGIDTGGVLARAVIAPTREDSFVTYPYLQLAAGLDALMPLLKQPLPKPINTSDEPSGMWYHPTIWGYLWRRMARGIR